MAEDRALLWIDGESADRRMFFVQHPATTADSFDLAFDAM
jgi:hypothetical protein